MRLILYPALCAGEGAVSSIVNGIRALDALGVDVIIVGRGGGSIEDLWAFNEEEVARAIFECEACSYLRCRTSDGHNDRRFCGEI